MGDDDESRHMAMVEFLGTFPSLSGSPPSSLSDLSDGVALFEVLSEIAPDFFDPTTIARHLGDNWALKSSNLRKLVRNLEHYYHEGLKKDADFSAVRLADMARHADAEAIAELVELVAAAAVTGESKGEVVGRIMQLSEDAQLQMKDILESSLGRLTEYDETEYEEDDGMDENELVFGEAGSNLKSDDEDDDEDEDDLLDGGRKLLSSNLFAADHFATGGAHEEELERALMEARRELAQQKSHSALLAEDQERAQAKLRALVEDLQERLGRRQEEMAGLEQDLKATRSELTETKSRLAELEEQKAQLADELDVATAKTEQLRKAEATVVAYKRKLEAVGVINQQMTDLEEQAASYLRQIMDLEAEVKKTTALQKTVDELQEKLRVTENDKTDVDSSLKTTTNEIAELKSRLSAAESAKKMYEDELAELRMQQQHNGGLPVEVNSTLASDELATGQSLSEIREKAMRLEIENQSLREKVEKLSEEGGGAAAAASVAASESSDEVKRLKVELAKKETEMKKIGNDKDKLEAYTKRTLAKFQDKYLVALQECKAKLKEKQDKIEALENRNASEKTAQKREERLMSSAIYELGLAIMQDRLKDR